MNVSVENDIEIHNNHKLDIELEKIINRQINMELYASYFYLGAARYFQRKDVALHNIADFFFKQSEEEKEHSNLFQKYLIMRGGNLVLEDIKSPPQQYDTILFTMKIALQLEIKINNLLHEIHKLAEKYNDPQLTDFLEGTFLKEQVESIKEFNDYITNLERVGEGLGEFMFDKHFNEINKN